MGNGKPKNNHAIQFMTSTIKPEAGIRVAALILEFFIMFVIIMIFSTPALEHDSFGLFRISHESYKLVLLNDPFIYLCLFGFSLMFFKDCINGQSIAKRLVKLQVVDNTTGAVATPMQCFLRNLTLLIFPLEVLIIFAQPDRRIGDKIAGTKLVRYNQLTNNNPERSLKNYILPLVLSYAIFVILAFGLGKISFNNSAAPFVVASYNETKSRSLEKLLTDHLNQYFTCSVKYYDSIENKKYDYISVICTFKKAVSPEPELAGQESGNRAIALVYSLFPEDQIHGKIQFVYRYENSMTTWNRIFGVRFNGDEGY